MQEQITAFSSLLRAKAQGDKSWNVLPLSHLPILRPLLSKINKNKQLNLSLFWTRFSFALNKKLVQQFTAQ